MRPRRPLQVASIAITTVLGVALAGWFGLVLGVVVWLGFRAFMHVRPWPPTSQT